VFLLFNEQLSKTTLVRVFFYHQAVEEQMIERQLPIVKTFKVQPPVHNETCGFM